MVFTTSCHVRFPFYMLITTFWHFNLSFAWYLLQFDTSNVHVGFFRASLGFRVSLGSHLWVLWGSFRVSFRVSSKNNLGFHLGFL